MYCSDYMFESISVKLPVSCLCCNLKSTKINFLSESRGRRASALKQMVGDDKNNLEPAGVILDEFPHAENKGKPSCCHGVFFNFKVETPKKKYTPCNQHSP